MKHQDLNSAGASRSAQRKEKIQFKFTFSPVYSCGAELIAESCTHPRPSIAVIVSEWEAGRRGGTAAAAAVISQSYNQFNSHLSNHTRERAGPRILYWCDMEYTYKPADTMLEVSNVCSRSSSLYVDFFYIRPITGPRRRAVLYLSAGETGRAK